jgi:hypothetical protein
MNRYLGFSFHPAILPHDVPADIADVGPTSRATLRGVSIVTISGGAYGYLEIDAQNRRFPNTTEYWDMSELDDLSTEFPVIGESPG